MLAKRSCACETTKSRSRRATLLLKEVFSWQVPVMLADLVWQTDPPGADGELVPLTPPFPQFVAPVSVKIGGLDAQVLYKGAAPGLIHGVGQINVLIPQGVAPGDAVPVEVMILKTAVARAQR